MQMRRLHHHDKPTLISRHIDRNHLVPAVNDHKRDGSWHVRCRCVKLFALLIVVVFLVETSTLTQRRQQRTKPGTSTESSTSLSAGRPTRRFPKYGTAEFTHQCGWSMPATTQAQDCTFLVRPDSKDTEGISKWACQISVGFLLARQAGCKLLLDYGHAIDVHEVLTPFPNLDSSVSANQLNNWTVPSGFHCASENRCVALPAGPVSSEKLASYGMIIGGISLKRIPYYRQAYSGMKEYQLDRRMYQGLEQILPGFQLESGMACSLSNLLSLALSASQFEPQLFTRILPTLHDEEALVIAIYIRTGHTDKAADAEAAGKVAEEDTTMHRTRAKDHLKCALNLEQQHLSGSEETGVKYSRVVWMLVTDSTYLKEWITESYDGKDANVHLPADQLKWKPRPIQREVLVTRSRGVHTRARRKPSTADFAQALIDWYLIGESDLVVAGGFSFGHTAALRTARPIYDPRQYKNHSACSKLVLVQESVPPS